MLVISPLLKVAGMEKTFEEVFQKHTYEEELRKIEEQTSTLRKSAGRLSSKRLWRQQSTTRQNEGRRNR